MTRVLGVDVGGTNTKVVRMDATGAIEHRSSLKTKGDEGPESFVARLVDHVSPICAGVTAMGLAVAALVRHDGSLQQAPNLKKFEGFDLQGELARALAFEHMAVENDVNAALLGEVRLGAARGAGHAAMLSLGTGVGGGLFIDGRLVRGHSGTAAEIGHTILDPEGPPCPCGDRGHVEAYLSAQAISRRASERLAQVTGPSRLSHHLEQAGAMSPRVISAAAHDGDALALEVVAESGYWLGLACVNVVHMFNPEVVVLGGGVAGLGEPLLDAARATLHERGMPGPVAAMRLVLAELGSEGAAKGAAVLALDSFNGAGIRPIA